MDLGSLIVQFLSPSALGSAVRSMALTGLTALAVKLGLDGSYAPTIATALGVIATAIYSMSLSTPTKLKSRTASLADVSHIELTNGQKIGG